MAALLEYNDRNVPWPPPSGPKDFTVYQPACPVPDALSVRSASIFLAAVVLTAIPVAHFASPLVSDEMLNRLRTVYSDEAYRRGIAINRLIDDLRARDSITQLREINRFFNQFEYQTDQAQWGEADYWATPFEFVGRQRGDCEDFVIAKYFALRKLGVPDERLYLTYVKALKQNVAHMVLSYFETPTSEPLILDNYNPKIEPASARQDLLPVYSFNAESLFLSNASAGLGRSLPNDRVRNSKWQKLLGEMGESGK